MAVTSNIAVDVIFSSDVEFAQRFAAAANSSSPGIVDSVDLANGANTVAVPNGATSVVIKPPVGNSQTITLKGVSGDTGISIHRTNPTWLGLNSVSSFVLTTNGTITGCRFIWG